MQQQAPLSAWLQDLEKRHTARFTPKELRKSVQALSTIYVQQRARLERAPLDSDGKRAAFALYFAPLHFLFLQRVIDGLGLSGKRLQSIVDLGCGTAVGGAAWALASGGTASVLAVDKHPWALGEARHTFASLGIQGRTRKGDLTGIRLPERGSGIIAAYAVNELANGQRERLMQRMLQAGGRGARVLVVEPIAKRPLPWWEVWQEAFVDAGGRADTWRFDVELPELLARMDRATKLNHRELTGRTLLL